tara:strand:- start:647 stop:997 length:351 start_codon:yes stop_codon:yes gene_type:complete
MNIEDADKLKVNDTVYVEEQLVDPFVLLVIGAPISGIILGVELTKGKPRRWCFPEDCTKISHDGAKKLSGLNKLESLLFDVLVYEDERKEKDGKRNQPGSEVHKESPPIQPDDSKH